jgi:uncharacterized protein DUF695
MNDKWMIARVATQSLGSGTFRYLQSKPELWDSFPLSEEISITWQYGVGLPDKATSAHMDVLEESLADLCFGKDSYLTLVMTVGGLREWCFYANDYDAFMKRLNSRLSSHERFPVSIQHSHDPIWSYWHSFVDRVTEKK